MEEPTLREAYSWYLEERRKLQVLGEWVRAGRPAAGGLEELVHEFRPLTKREALDKLRTQREDVERMAIVRLFAAFEVDFANVIIIQLSSKFPSATASQIRSSLPDAIEGKAKLWHALDSRFSSSDKGWLDGLRGFRNEVVHGAFAEPMKYIPEDVHKRLERILTSLQNALP